MQLKLITATLVALALCGCRNQADVVDLPEEYYVPEKVVASPEAPGRPRVAFLATNYDDPWVQRVVDQAKLQATDDHVNFLLIKAPTAEKLQEAIKKFPAMGIDGCIVNSPDPDEDAAILKQVHSTKLKAMSLDDPIRNGDGTPTKLPMLGCDFKNAGTIAANAMIAVAAKDRFWHMSRTGLILFTNDSLRSAKDVTTQEKKILLANGITPDRVFEIPLHDLTIAGARRMAAVILANNSVAIRDWFIGGFNDTVVVGGLRATEDVHIGTKRTIGVGIEGDGALYDLQRPIKSGLAASVLFSSNKMGQQAEKGMDAWLLDKVRPFQFSPFRGVLLNRDNVRQLKRANQMLD